LPAIRLEATFSGEVINMDGNSHRRLPLDVNRRRVQNLWKTKHITAKFLKTHKRTLITIILLGVLMVLLFGIAGQLPPPSTDSIPNGVTPVSYSAFIAQVKAGNVEAVTLQGNAINGLLVSPLSQQTPAAIKPSASSAHIQQSDFEAWSRYVGAGYPSWPNTNASSVDPSLALYTHLPPNGDTTLLPLLENYHVVVNTLPPATTPAWLATIWKFLPIAVFLLIILLMLAPKNGSRSTRQMDERISQFAKGRVKRFERVKEGSGIQMKTNAPTQARAQKKPAQPSQRPTPSGVAAVTTARPRTRPETPVTFADVAGIDEVRTELEEIVQFLRLPEKFDRLGARIPRGALLVGPPGTGKTLLAKAVAGEAGVPFFSMSASEFVEMFVGVGASRVRDLFNQARQASPCVVFIDELDAVGRKRSLRVTGNDERDQTLNQLLVELDGFDSRQAVVVLAATNRVDILDKALLRPGRFDRTIAVSMPDRAGREAILKVHTRRTPLHEDVSLDRLARLTTGMSGADLANLVNEAALSAARRDQTQVNHECFEDALARVQLGALRPIVMSEVDRRIIAFHEGGHALVAHLLPQADTVNRVTILPRGQSLGVTQFTAEEDRYNYSRETLMARIAVGLGGRASEELTFGPNQVTTGAENDFQVVTNLARRMVTHWGMSERVGVIFADYQPDPMSMNMRKTDLESQRARPRSLVADADGNLHLNGGDAPDCQSVLEMSAPVARDATSSVSMASAIDQEVQRIIQEGYEMARAILREHNDQLVKLADALMEHEQLNRQQFEALMRE
jgi:ATP-dependent metalloprotease FtsH